MTEPRPTGGEVGDLAIVLHSHMPYVEGFGTWPFGEEWLFDAVARSYLPVLEVARDLTVTVSPVLADQLEAPGVVERMKAFLRRHRLEAARLDAIEGPAELRPAAEFEAERYRRALDRLDALDGDLLAAFRIAAREGGAALLPSAATHAVLPLVATTAGRRLQIDAGLRSHRRRFGAPQGFWLPECAYRPALEPLLAERDLAFFCTDQSAFEAPLDALAPVRRGGRPGRLHARLGGGRPRLVAGRLSVRGGLRRLPSSIAGGNAAVGDRRRPIRPRRRHSLRGSARAPVRTARSPAA